MQFLDQFIMLGTCIKAFQDTAGFRRDMRRLIILAGKCFDIFQRVKPHYCYKFHFIIQVPSQYLNRPVTRGSCP